MEDKLMGDAITAITLNVFRLHLLYLRRETRAVGRNLSPIGRANNVYGERTSTHLVPD